MNKIKVNFFVIVFLLILSACNTAKEAFTQKKNSGSEEFLVQKKSPLVMPPEFDVLPIPMESKSEDESGNKSLEKLITGSNSITSENKTDKTKKFNSSIEELILEKIKNN
tara:strand:- start:185 stop:514 length:330 start_codon:yes stop_codon:yes gene_type:complete